MPVYNPAEIERRWQAFWESNKTFRTADPSDTSKPKSYVLDMFPYPSGAGLHVGHPEGYTATDITVRMKRMQGFHVLHPIGWDAFGLPAEQYAVEKNIHPSITTRQNIDTFRRQIKALGFSYDWDREVDTTDPNYFKWTQWIFLLIYDTWFDPAQQKGRPIAELPIPPDVMKQGDAAVLKYRDDHRLAYIAEVPVNWCAELGTVLANEEVIDGKSERGNYPVVRMPLRQWLMRITAYAEPLLHDLDGLDWSESIKQMQRNWIGKSEGAEVDFKLASGGHEPEGPIRVYTTRPDTLFGATYMVLSPEHRLVDLITTSAQRDAVKAYQDAAAHKSDFERTELAKKKTGVFTGAYAVNPVNGKEIPVWIADYVLATYGTGAIMAVPGHDERDWEFAKEFGLSIECVVTPSWPQSAAKQWATTFDNSQYKFFLFVPNDHEWVKNGTIETQLQKWTNADTMLDIKRTQDGFVVLSKGSMGYLNAGHLASGGLSFCESVSTAYSGEGFAVNSGILDRLPTAEAKAKIIAWLEERKLGTRKVNYKLRDWLFSRQRYWGEPFPVLHAPDGSVIPLSPDQLPLTLPELADFKPTGSPEGPVAKATDWVNVAIDGKPYKRETNTMPQWAGSCWYFLRYIDPHNKDAFADPAKLKYWMPVDLYVGGAEHAVLHLLYSRFWYKVLADRGYVPGREPFQKFVNQGMILGENGEKMSKARGNVVNPDDVIAEYGADSLRLYEMFMGPLEAVKPWQMNGVEGVYRFLGKVWRAAIDERAETMQLHSAVQDVEPDRDTLRLLHRTIQKVTHDTDAMRYNTAISAMMEFNNHFGRLEVRPRMVLETFVFLLAPYAPHIAEELWAALGHATTLAYEPWPTFDPALTKADEIEIPVQVNGKLKSRLTVPAEIDDAALETAALADPKVQEAIAGKPVKLVKVVPKRLVNVVVG